MVRRTRWRAVLGLGLVALGLASCGLDGFDAPFLEPSELATRHRAIRSAAPVKSQGWVVPELDRAARRAQESMGSSVERLAEVVDELRGHAPTRRDGPWEVYGPFEDPSGAPLQWTVRVRYEGDSTFYGFDVTRTDPPSEPGPILRVADAAVQTTNGLRRGELLLHLDELARSPGLEHALFEASQGFTDGQLRVVTEVAGERRVLDVELSGGRSLQRYTLMQETPERAWVLALTEVRLESFEGPRPARVEAILGPQGDGRARAIVEMEDAASSSSVSPGIIEECLGAGGRLTWRGLGGGLASSEPDFEFGDPQSCELSASALDAPPRVFP